MQVTGAGIVRRESPKPGAAAPPPRTSKTQSALRAELVVREVVTPRRSRPGRQPFPRAGFVGPFGTESPLFDSRSKWAHVANSTVFARSRQAFVSASGIAARPPRIPFGREDDNQTVADRLQAVALPRPSIHRRRYPCAELQATVIAHRQ